MTPVAYRKEEEERFEEAERLIESQVLLCQNNPKKTLKILSELKTSKIMELAASSPGFPFFAMEIQADHIRLIVRLSPTRTLDFLI
jgi:REP element-mobilizing transposase RayT